MIFLKLLINFSIGMIFLGVCYALFYFEVIPKLIAHYRKVASRSKQYDSEINFIHKDK